MGYPARGVRSGHSPRVLGEEPLSGEIDDDFRDRLATADPADRASLVLARITADPEGRLRVSTDGAQRAILDGVDLRRSVVAALRRESGEGPVAWWDDASATACFRSAELVGARLVGAKLAGIDLGGADLSKTALGGADLRRANLENADLSGADLAQADLRGASLGNAILGGAMFEEAKLAGAGLRFVHAAGAAFEQADLRRADLWGAELEGAQLDGADLRRAVLKEAKLRGADLSGADLRGASLGGADLADADLTGADLRGADLAGASLEGASLVDAKLEGLDLTVCRITRIKLHGARLDRVRLTCEGLGEAVGEELSGEYAGARKAYLVLERAFEDLGDHDAASWAYRRRRRMQKQGAGKAAREHWQGGRIGRAAREGIRVVSDQLVEWLCDYGESVPRVLATMIAVYLLFAVIYGATGSVVHVHTDSAGHQVRTVTRSIPDLAIFSLLAMTTSGSPAVGLEPRDELVHLLTGVQALIGIALTGLLGFVMGNLVRR